MSQVHRLALGTAEAMPGYGIGAISHPNRGQFIELLQAAYLAGIRWFDTATSYGGAEHACLTMLPSSAKVVTKIWPEVVNRHWQFPYMSACQMPEAVLLHNPTCEQIPKAAPDVDGASVYTEAEARAVIAAGLGYLQVPLSIFDGRFWGVLREAKERGVTTFVRSVFLQGALVNLEPGEVLQRAAAKGMALPPQTPAMLRVFVQKCQEYGISRVEAALRYALESPADYVVCGCGSLDHLSELASIAERPAPANWPACFADLCDTFAGSAVSLGSIYR